jgi:hypothetical protein
MSTTDKAVKTINSIGAKPLLIAAGAGIAIVAVYELVTNVFKSTPSSSQQTANLSGSTSPAQTTNTGSTIPTSQGASNPFSLQPYLNTGTPVTSSPSVSGSYNYVITSTYAPNDSSSINYSPINYSSKTSNSSMVYSPNTSTSSQYTYSPKTSSQTEYTSTGAFSAVEPNSTISSGLISSLYTFLKRGY